MKKAYLFISIFVLTAVLLLSFTGCSVLNNNNGTGKGNDKNGPYTLRFNTNGVGYYEPLTFNKVTVIKESDIEEPADEKKTFVGWYLDINYYERVTFPYTINSNVVFYAKWEDKNCLTIQTDINDKKTFYYDQYSEIKEEDIEAPASEEKIFDGWYSDSLFSEKVKFPYTIKEDTIFYAKWKNKPYLVLKSNSAVISKNYYLENTVINENDLIIPSGNNKIFEGWYLDYSLTNKVSFPYTVNSNVTFYAKWKNVDLPVKVSFETNTNETINPILINKGAALSEGNIKTLSLYNKTFKGWYLDSNFNNKVSFPYVVNSDITLYAKWEDKLTLSLQVAENNNIISFYDKDSIVNEENLQIPSMDGKVFAGWYLESSCINNVSFPYTITTNTVFYAKWEDEDIDNTVKVTFVTNIDESIDAITLNKGSVLNEGNIKVLSTVEKTFKGWYLDSEFVTIASFPLTINENTTLYACWENNVILNTQIDESQINSTYYTKGTVIKEEDIEIPSKEDKIFAGWYLDSSYTNKVSFPYTLNSDAKFYAKWNERSVAVSFVTNIEETLSPINLNKNTSLRESNIKTLTCESKTFLGWYLDSDFASKVVFPYTVSEDVTFYAKWQDYIFLEYVTNCDIALEKETFMNVTTLNETDVKKPQDSIEREFLGWYVDSDLTTPVSFPYNLTKSTVFYAKWKITDICTINYYIDSTLYTYKYKKGDKVIFEDLVTEYPWYAREFKAFYYDAEFTKKVEFPFTITENLNLYILWEEFYVIEFDTNGGTEVEKLVGTVYLHFADVPNSKKFGYDFVGLATDKEGKNMITDYPYKIPESGTKLYYIWEKLPEIEYKVSFGSTIENDFEDMYLSILTEDVLPTPTKDGYTFVCWCYDDNNITPIEMPYFLRCDFVLQARYEKVISIPRIPRDEEAMTKIKSRIQGISLDFLSTLYSNYGIGYIGSFRYSSTVKFMVDAYNTTPEESTDDYITNYILQNGTCFDALRNNILDYSSVDALKNNTNSFRYQITLDTIDKWWNYEYPVEMEEVAKEYLTNFIDNNWERMQYELLCYMLNKKDQLNNFTSSNLEALYNEYLQIYTYFGFTEEDAVEIKELLLSIAPETYDDSILNYNSVVEEFIEYYILQEEAMYGDKSALE